MRQVTAVGGWSPVKFMAPVNEGPFLGQQMTVPVGTIPIPKPALIDSALAAFLTDAVAATATGMLAYTYGKAGSKWAAFFWAVSGIAGFKGLVDLSRIRER